MAPRRAVAAEGGTLVLDSEGLSKLAAGHPDVRASVATAFRQGARVVIASVTITEVMRGDARDANLNRVIAASGSVVSVDESIAREAAVLLRRSGLGGGRCTVDALVVAVAARQATPVVILTSDLNDINALVAETGLPKGEILVRHV